MSLSSRSNAVLDRDAAHLVLAGDDDLDHAAAGHALDLGGRELVLGLLHVGLHFLRLPHQLAQALHRSPLAVVIICSHLLERMLSGFERCVERSLDGFDVRIGFDRFARLAHARTLVRAAQLGRRRARRLPDSDREPELAADTARAAPLRGACAAAGVFRCSLSAGTTSCHAPPAFDARSQLIGELPRGPAQIQRLQQRRPLRRRAATPRSARARAAVARCRPPARGSADRPQLAPLARVGASRGAGRGDAHRTGRSGARPSSAAGRNASIRSNVISKPMRGSRQIGRSLRPCSAI